MGQPELQPNKQIRVLIADDSAFMRRALQRLLERAPGVVVVDTASDGVEAVRKALEVADEELLERQARAPAAPRPRLSLDRPAEKNTEKKTTKKKKGAPK